MKRTALIVDDNRSLAEDLAEILQGEGYDACVFFDPLEVLAVAARLSFHVALIDVRMPGLDGVALQQQLRKRFPEARYVMMSAYTEDERVCQALASGACAVLAKPIPLPALFAMLSDSALA